MMPALILHSACRRVFSAGVVLLLAACAPAPDRFPLASGEYLSFSELKGQVLLINYWAEWCRPCITEIPEFNHFQKDTEGQVRVLGVNFDGVVGDELQQAVTKLKIEFDVLAKDPVDFYQQERPVVLPSTFVIDASGRFHQLLIGPQTRESLSAAVTAAKNL